MNSLGRRLVLAAGWQVAGNALRIALGLVASVLFVRWLGATEFGRASWFLSLCLYISVLISAGLGTPITRRLTRARQLADTAGARHLLGRLLLLRGLSLVPAAAALAVVAWWLPADLGPPAMVWLVLALLAISFIHAALVRVLQVHFRQDLVAGLLVLEIASKLAVVWALQADHAQAATLLLGAIASELAVVTVAGWQVARALRRAPNANTEEAPRPGLGAMLREGRPTWLLSLAQRLLGRDVDVLIIGLAASPEEVTRYALGFAVASLGISLTSSAMQGTTNLSAFTEFSGTRSGRRSLQRAMAEVWLLLVAPAAVGGALVGPRILHLLYGDAAAGTALICGLLFVALALMELASLGKDAMLGSGHDRQAARIHAVSGATNLLLTLALVRPLGATGAALATLVGAVVAVVLTYRPELTPSRLAAMRRPLLVTGAALAVLAVAVGHLGTVTPTGLTGSLTLVAAGIAVYLLTLRVLGPCTSLRRQLGHLPASLANLVRGFC